MDKLQRFNFNKKNFKITRILHLVYLYEFLNDKKLHFSPFSEFPDLMEGKTFKQAKFIEDPKAIDSDKRRKVLYASCWYIGKENLNMWDNYGKKSKDMLAIQVDFDSFADLFNYKNMEFSSKKLLNDDSPNFRLNKLFCGFIKYVDFSKKDYSKESIGRFKSHHFKHEKEFRFLVSQNYKNNENDNNNNNKIENIIGLKDLKCYFDKDMFDKIKITVIVSPYASDNYFEFIKDVFKKFKNVNIKQSKFYELFN